MDRSQVAAGFLLTCLVLSGCNNGGPSSPTAPDPVPDSLAGSWRGEISGNAGGGAFNCTLDLNLGDLGDGFFFGSWSAQCGGAQVGSSAAATAIGGFTILTGFGSDSGAAAAHPLGTCGWGGPVELRGNQLVGTWTAPLDCPDGSLVGGPVTLRFLG